VSCLQVAGGLVVTGGFDGQVDSAAIQAVAASTDELDERSDVQVVAPNADREIQAAEELDEAIDRLDSAVQDITAYDVPKERQAELIEAQRKFRYYSGSPERFDWLADEEEEIAKYAAKYANVVSDDYYLPVQEREFPLEEKVEYIDDVLLNGNLMDGEQAESLVDNDLKENHPFYRFREELAVAGGVVEIEKDLADLDQEEWRNQRQRQMKARLQALHPIISAFKSLREERLKTLFVDFCENRMTHGAWLKQYQELNRRSPGELLAIKRAKLLSRRLKAMNKSNKNDNFCIAPDVPVMERLPNWEPSQKLAIINLWGWEEGRRPLSRSKNHRRKCCGRRGHKQGSWVNRLAWINEVARVDHSDNLDFNDSVVESKYSAADLEAILGGDHDADCPICGAGVSHFDPRASDIYRRIMAGELITREEVLRVLAA
jgi:hypothetical protein